MNNLATPSYLHKPGSGRVFSPVQMYNSASIDYGNNQAAYAGPLAAGSDLKVGTTFSCGVWVKTNNSPASDLFAMHGLKGVGSVDVFALGIRGGIYTAFFTAGASTTYGTTLIDDNMWHLIGGTYDGSDRRIWVDGINENTDATVVSIGEITHFGFGVDLGASSNFWIGNLDEGFLYDGIALDQKQWTNIYNKGRPRNLNSYGPTGNLVGWYRMDTEADPQPNSADGSNGEDLGTVGIDEADMKSDVPS